MLRNCSMPGGFIRESCWLAYLNALIHGITCMQAPWPALAAHCLGMGEQPGVHGRGVGQAQQVLWRQGRIVPGGHPLHHGFHIRVTLQGGQRGARA